MSKRTWYAWVNFGGHDRPAKGPYPSRAAADAALRCWRERLGWRAGSAENAGSLRLYGYSTRAAARNADISDQIGSRGKVE